MPVDRVDFAQLDMLCFVELMDEYSCEFHLDAHGVAFVWAQLKGWCGWKASVVGVEKRIAGRWRGGRGGGLWVYMRQFEVLSALDSEYVVCYDPVVLGLRSSSI